MLNIDNAYNVVRVLEFILIIILLRVCIRNVIRIEIESHMKRIEENQMHTRSMQEIETLDRD